MYSCEFPQFRGWSYGHVLLTSETGTTSHHSRFLSSLRLPDNLNWRDLASSTLHRACDSHNTSMLNSRGFKWALIIEWLHANCFFPPSDYNKHFQNQTISFQIRIWKTNPGISWEIKLVYKPYFVNNIILLPHADNFWEETQHDAEAAWTALRSTIN